MRRTEAGFFGSLEALAMIEKAGSGVKGTTWKQTRKSVMDLFAEVAVVCDAVHSSCLWAQHATAFSSEILDAERQQPSSAPRWHCRLRPMPACLRAIPYQTPPAFPSGQRTWPCQSWPAPATRAPGVGRPGVSSVPTSAWLAATGRHAGGSAQMPVILG